MKNNKKLKVVLLIVGLLLLFFGVYAILFKISENRQMAWQSGKLIIVNKEIQLPCTIEEFEKKFNIEINRNNMNTVKINIDKNTYLNLILHIDNDTIYAITNKIIPSSKSLQNNICYDCNSHIESALIVYPANITSNNKINEIKKEYSSKPLNIYYKEYSEYNTYSQVQTTSYRYHDKNFEIQILTEQKEKGEEEIVEITYMYLNLNKIN